MRDSIISDIRKIRSALESFDKSDFPENTSFYQCKNGFPAGCCGDTSDLIGLYLKSSYGVHSEYVLGKGLGNNRNQTHAWLMCDGYIIDITADQFNSIGYNQECVIISQNSEFHESFSRFERHEINAKNLNRTSISDVLHEVRERIRTLAPAL